MVDGLLEHGSYLGITVVLILTGCGLPVPEEVPIIAAGVLSRQGVLNPWFALAACLVGALVGDSLMYWIGRRFGRSVLQDHPAWTGFLTPERERQIEQLIHRHGLKVLFVSRFLVAVRSPVYITAGILRVPFRRFLIIDLFCATIVVSLFFGLSYAFGDWIGEWIRRAEIGLTVIVAIAILAAALVAWRIHRKMKLLAAIQESDRGDSQRGSVDEALEERPNRVA